MARPRQISTEKILETALQCFLEHGMGVATQVIADRLGISQPALFKRFGTKKELIVAALAPPARLPLTKWIDEGPHSGEFRPQLEELLGKLWETLKILLPRLMLLMESKIDVKEFHKRYKVLPIVYLLMSIAGWFERAQQKELLRADGNPEFWALSCLGTLHGRAITRVLLNVEFGPDDDAAYIESVVDVLYRGMKPEVNNAL